ncbi:MAG: archaeosortase/exosortase family protein [Blastochloris sp.]|nr:archaeosortase/exosortase family protein [Blastochloris sp.]
MSYAHRLQSSTQNVNTLFSLLILIAFANGFYGRIYKSIDQYGVIDSIYATFGISIVVLFAAWMVYDLISRSSVAINTRLDVAVLTITLSIIIIPSSEFTWLALTVLSIYYLLQKIDDNARYGFSILLAICYSVFWAKLVSKVFMDYISVGDAFFVALLTGTHAEGNLIKAADGITTLSVGGGCSSFNNLSIAVLGWIVARAYFGTRGLKRSLVFVTLSLVSVVFINTVRIGIMALDPSTYEIVHGAIGNNITNLLITISIGLISYYGARK